MVVLAATEPEAAGAVLAVGPRSCEVRRVPSVSAVRAGPVVLAVTGRSAATAAMVGTVSPLFAKQESVVPAALVVPAVRADLPAMVAVATVVPAVMEA